MMTLDMILVAIECDLTYEELLILQEAVEQEIVDRDNNGLEVKVTEDEDV